MITQAQMFWLVKLDDLQHLLKCITWLPIVLAVVTVVMAFAIFMMTFDAKIEIKKEAAGDIARLMVMFVFMLLIVVALQVVAAFTPSTRQMAAIIVVPKIANSEKIQIAGNKLYDLAVEWMDELRPSKGEKGTK